MTLIIHKISTIAYIKPDHDGKMAEYHFIGRLASMDAEHYYIIEHTGVNMHAFPRDRVIWISQSV